MTTSATRERQGASVATEDEGAFLDRRPLVDPIQFDACRASNAGQAGQQKPARPAPPFANFHIGAAT